MTGLRFLAGALVLAASSWPALSPGYTKEKTHYLCVQGGLCYLLNAVDFDLSQKLSTYISSRHAA